MKQEFTIASNGNWLSLANAQILKAAILIHFPSLTINTISTQNKNADFSISTPKPLTAENLIGAPHAFIHRGDIRNIAIFNKNIEAKITVGEPLKLIIDKNLPQQLFEKFLQKGLPQLNATPVTIDFVFIDDKSEDQLEDVLQNKDVDGCIIALAHINDLLQYPALQEEVSAIIADKKWMLLPLFECPPLAGQGTVVATTTPDNTDAISILEKCNNQSLSAIIKTETAFEASLKHLVKHGIFHVETSTTTFSFAAGIDSTGKTFTNWDFETPDILKDKLLFSSTDYMKDFFSYQLLDGYELNQAAKNDSLNLFLKATHLGDKGQKAVFVSSHKAIHSTELLNGIATKKVWAAGTRTWYELAKKGIWVSGCADGLGMESLHTVWQSPFINLHKKDFLIITNLASTIHWKADGWHTLATYELIPEPSAAIREAIRNAGYIFWTSFQQYEMYKGHVKPNTKHLCPAGKTAKLLLEQGFTPIVFPTIKAFLDWRSSNTTG